MFVFLFCSFFVCVCVFVFFAVGFLHFLGEGVVGGFQNDTKEPKHTIWVGHGHELRSQFHEKTPRDKKERNLRRMFFLFFSFSLCFSFFPFFGVCMCVFFVFLRFLCVLVSFHKCYCLVCFFSSFLRSIFWDWFQLCFFFW